MAIDFKRELAKMRGELKKEKEPEVLAKGDTPEEDYISVPTSGPQAPPLTEREARDIWVSEGGDAQAYDYLGTLDPAPRFEFLTGLAGTGKSWQTKDRHSKYRGGELVATTGIAAINVGGTTINSLLRYFDTGDLAEAMRSGRLVRMMVKLFESGVRRIYLDEASMLDGRQLTLLTQAALESDNYVQGWTEERLGITLVGDACQLPPVKAPWFFESPEWGRYLVNTTRLTEIKRQDNRDFTEALNNVRAGKGLLAVEYFRAAGAFQKFIEQDYPGPTVMAKNDEVDRYNALRLKQCEGETFLARAVKQGKLRSEWKHIPDELLLKEGAQVMVLANRTEQGHLVYANGDIGDFVLQASEQVWDRENFDYRTIKGPGVRLHRNGETHVVVRVERENKELDEDQGTQKVVGTVDYLPLRLAWATTTHKSQGLSYDAVQVNITNHFFQSPGMCYVALSRARAPEGLRIVGSPEAFIRRCVYDPKVRMFL